MQFSFQCGERQRALTAFHLVIAVRHLGKHQIELLAIEAYRTATQFEVFPGVKLVFTAPDSLRNEYCMAGYFKCFFLSAIRRGGRHTATAAREKRVQEVKIRPPGDKLSGEKQMSKWIAHGRNSQVVVLSSTVARASFSLLLSITLLQSLAFAQNGALDQARQLFARGAYNRASQELQSELKLHPQDADAHLLLGQIYAIQSRRAEAIQQLSRAIELQPKSAAAFDVLGTALSRFAEFDAARKAFEKAIALDPNLVEAHIYLAMSLAEEGNLKGAAEQLDTAIELRPSGPTAARAHYLLAKLYEDQDSKQAIKELVLSSKLNPHDEQTWLELGNLKSESGDETGALAAFQHAVVCAPQDAQAQYELGSEYLMQGDPRKAVIHLELARKGMPNPTIAVLYELDRALRKVGRDQDAAKVRAQAQRLIAQNSEANLHFQQAQILEHDGVALEDSGNSSEALKKLKAALEINPEQNRFRYNYALALCHAGRWQDGIAQLREVIDNDPGDVEARRALFIAMDKAKQATSDSPSTKMP